MDPNLLFRYDEFDRLLLQLGKRRFVWVRGGKPPH
jgi:hypothetical protein